MDARERARKLADKLDAERLDPNDPAWEAQWVEIVAAELRAAEAEALERAARVLEEPIERLRSSADEAVRKYSDMIAAVLLTKAEEIRSLKEDR